MTFCLRLDPADTMAIGDGRPFNQADAGRAVAASVFPPPPDTLFGATRVACAKALGWDGVGGWSAEIAEVLGSWQSMKDFAISGPFFRAEGEVLLPIPSHIFLRVEAGRQSLLSRHPVDYVTTTDLGELRLPDIPPYEAEVDYHGLSGRWARAEAVLDLLRGKDVVPGDLGKSSDDASSHLPKSPLRLPGWSLSDLAAAEFRVGLAREAQTRKAIEGQLYTTVRRALRRNVEMFVEVQGFTLPNSMNVPVPLGGEARFAFASTEQTGLPSWSNQGAERYLIYCASPVIMAPPAPGDGINGFSGQLVMASIPQVTTHGGRSGQTGKGGTRNAARTVLPAGSVFFVENGTQSILPKRIGAETHLGYGRYFSGVWQ